MSIRNDRRREHRKDRRIDKTDPRLQEVATELTRKLMDEGKLVEAGWRIFEAAFIPPQVGDVQRNDMRIAFFSGAEHTFNSIVAGLEDGTSEATPMDEARMDKLNAELARFRSFLEEEFDRRRPR
jgi:hypothetical protein